MKKVFKVLIVISIMIMFLPLCAISASIDILATNSSLSQSKKDVNTDELTSDDWALITSSNSDSKSSGSFDFIKNNTNENNNGKWMLYLGITFIALSVIGIVYVIFSTIVPNLKN